MRPSHAVISILSVAAALTISCKGKAPTGEMHQVASSREAMLARGQYLARVSACEDCHTPGGLYGAPDRSRMLSGSDLGWQGPWGVSYPPNLTPDMETGLGSWTEEEIAKAIRTGVARGGRKILPPMPWPNYANYTDEDVYALTAYLKSLPAVRHKSPDPLPPGTKPQGAFVPIPPPPAWDAPRTSGVGGGPQP